ncbi:glycosyltransferase family 2 protein [Arthrobacter alpinus]|uniref:glycosyltransferase family 2 protein n=1 Tax=Arthrobacter alpinus TaxID=656366 RepID=UPI001479B7D2|nr:glycosyltransferase family 2 protein [Arthrobacter alpinus]
MLRNELGERNVISLDGRKNRRRSDSHKGYGAAVDAVLEYQTRQLKGASPQTKIPARVGATGGSSHSAVLNDEVAVCNEWIWLLQDDAAPAPDALERLLEATERATTATVVGCKQLDWENHRRLVDVGLWANTWFDRFTLVGLDELDQGQYDDNSDMFAVNTAGMLVRRDVFERLGGFDPALPGPGDDLDFCARVRLAGDRVLVVPAAHMFHAVQRPNGLGTSVAARKAGIFLRLKHAPLWAVPFLAVGTFFAALYWLVAGFVLKAPGHAIRIFAATCAGLLRPAALTHSRKALAEHRSRRRSVHKGVLVDNKSARTHLKALREAVGPDEEHPQEIHDGPSILEPTGEAHHESVTPLTVIKTAPLVSALGVVALLTILSLIALSRFLGAPALTGGALLPVSEQMALVWQHATDWWVSLGSGLAGRGNPFNFVLGILSSLGGNGSLAVLWMVLLALPLSGFTAWLATGALSLRRWPRVVAALAWAGAPVLLVGMGQGRVGALIAHILIPVVMLGLVRAVGGAVSAAPKIVTVPGALPGTKSATISKLGRPGVDRNPSWTAAAAAGLALAVVTAAAPSLLPIAVVGILLTAVFMRGRGKTIWWALVPPAALFLPLVWSAWGNPRAIFGDPGVPLASAVAPIWQQVLGFPEQVNATEGLLGLGALVAAPWWTWVAVAVIGAPVIVGAAVALVLPLRRSNTVRAFWLVALLALAAAYATKFIAVAFDGVTLVTPFSGPAISVAFFALLGAAILGLDAVHTRAWHPSYAGTAGNPDTVQHHRTAKTMATLLSVILVAAPVASLGLWATQQLSEQPGVPALTGSFLPHGVTAGTIPATAADRGTGPEASRTIVLTVMTDGGVQASLMQGAGTTLDAMSTIATASRIAGSPGSETVLDSDPATAALEDTVAAMLSKSGIDPRAGLVELGVGFVVLRNGDTAAELLAGELEAVPGLDTVGPTDSGWLWRVKPTYVAAGLTDVVNRVRIVDSTGKAVAPVDSQDQNVSAEIPAGGSGRLVVLAERADSGWQATLNGAPLNATNSEWAQAFELPQDAGTLEIRYVHPLHAVMTLVQLVLFGLTVLLALPVRARRGRTGAYRDESSLQKVGRSA